MKRTVERGVADLVAWVLAVLLLWKVGELGLRQSAVLSLLLALILDQVIAMQLDEIEPKESQGVYSVVFKPDFQRILEDLGIIDSSTDSVIVDALSREPSNMPKFPIGWFWCTWIPDAHLYVAAKANLPVSD